MLRERLESSWHIAIDVGQVVDYSCAAAIERRTAWLPDGRHSNKPIERAPEYFLRGLERLPLGLDYEVQGQMIARLVQDTPAEEAPDVWIDGTGVGRAVAEIFRRYLPDARMVIITASREAERHGRDWHVGKIALISQLMAKMHSGVLKAAEDIPLWPILQQELQDFRMKFTTTNLSFNAREGRHDDALLAVAIACWAAERGSQRMQLVKTLGF